jgi:hypothetical protein
VLSTIPRWIGDELVYVREVAVKVSSHLLVVDLADFREYCLTKSNVTEGTPFGEDTLVFKVGGKMFALASLDDVPPRVNLSAIPSARSSCAIDTRKSSPVIT